MKIDPNAPAIPVIDRSVNNERQEITHWEWRGGITIRAELASRNLAGLMANPHVMERATPTDVIWEALRYADLLIAKLNEEPADKAKAETDTPDHLAVLAYLNEKDLITGAWAGMAFDDLPGFVQDQIRTLFVARQAPP